MSGIVAALLLSRGVGPGADGPAEATGGGAGVRCVAPLLPWGKMRERKVIHMRKATTLVVVLLGAVAGLATPELTIYTGGFGLVRETRSVFLSQEGDLMLEGLPLTTLLDSLVFEGLTMTRMVPTRLGLPTVEDLVGTTVTVFAHGERFQGRLVAAGAVLVLATREGLVFLPAYDRIVAPPPKDPVLGESLVLKVRYRDATPGQAVVGLRYLAEGLDWSVNYAATLGGGKLFLHGLATLENRTGIDFLGARVSLVAGDVYRPTPRPAARAVFALAIAADVEAVPAFEYHRYAFHEPVDLVQGVTLAPLVNAELAYVRAYQFAGGPVEVRVRFTNTVAPLPGGEVRVYDMDGRLFVGAATIRHTPVGEKVDLAIGAAFDLIGERILEARQRLTEDLYRDTYRITLRSAKSDPVEVEVVETLSGAWTITHADLPYERLDAHRILFRVAVPAAGTAEVRYTVEWRF